MWEEEWGGDAPSHLWGGEFFALLYEMEKRGESDKKIGNIHESTVTGKLLTQSF